MYLSIDDRLYVHQQHTSRTPRVKTLVNSICVLFISSVDPSTCGSERSSSTIGEYRCLALLDPVEDMYACMVITYSKIKDQPEKVGNPPHGQLNREYGFFPVPVSAREFGLTRRVR